MTFYDESGPIEPRSAEQKAVIGQLGSRLREIALAVYNMNAFRAGQIDDIADEVESQAKRIAELTDSNQAYAELVQALRDLLDEARAVTPPPAARPEWDSTRFELLESFKSAILAGCTENEYCGPHPGDLWGTLIGECQPREGSGVVRDANNSIVDCAACGSSGQAIERTRVLHGNTGYVCPGCESADPNDHWPNCSAVETTVTTTGESK